MKRLVIARITFTVRFNEDLLTDGLISRSPAADAVQVIEEFLEEAGFQIHDATEVVSHGDKYLFGCKAIPGGD